MGGQRPNLRVVAAVLVAGVLVLGQQTAFADTIYLKNGRVIRTPRAEVRGNQLVFLLYGGEVRIPMALVERVVEDDEVDEGAVVEPPPRRRASPTKERDRAGAAASDKAGGGEPQGEGGKGEAEEIPAEQTPEYWQERVRTILQEKADLEAQLPELRREERAFLFSHRSTSETRRQIEAVQQRLRELEQELVELRQQARRLGVPPGWLRVREQG